MILTGVMLSYAAWFGFFHADKSRSTYVFLNGSALRSNLTLFAAWALSFLAAYPCILAFGLERGITAWLALVTTMGMATIFTIRVYQNTSQKLGILCLLLAPISFALSLT